MAESVDATDLKSVDRKVIPVRVRARAPSDFIGVAAMRQVGSRREQGLALNASGSLLTEGARFNEAVSRLSQSTFVPKGIYRFRSHEAANKHAEDCLVRGMGLLAAMRACSGQ